MRIYDVRGLRIGEGRPKLIAPIVARTREQALAQAARLIRLPVDIAEWRADHLHTHAQEILSTLHELRKVLSIPLLFTYRTHKEGGEGGISLDAYTALNRRAVQSGDADLIDVELSAGKEAVAALAADIRSKNALSVVSSHHFSDTPPKDEIVNTLLAMQAIEADIPKFACMPNNTGDVLTLLAASAEFKGLTDRPFLCISMGELGIISRIAGETFGSALTFGAAEEASAPGQLPAVALAAMLDALHCGKR